ncbi:aspartate dehydrogenase domain-containing protein isoform X2 [Stegostoma tigrinum]|uniref:aspartate dehydrogenase domain-containing protein isoform X2 n=1 Tax=Stegostoma tigrinum TaxID=3053191 RepID=UPI00202B72E4|nr:aspartate dehydrogenase domain-containing protein isoform X2 [Stegostoma tigrinum]
MAHERKSRRIGIVGFGHLGQYLTEIIEEQGHQYGLELAFVWNRNQKKMEGKVRKEVQLEDLSMFVERCADLIVEVAHPQIIKDYGEEFLKHADCMGLKVTMSKHPDSFKLRGHLQELKESMKGQRVVLYDGSVRNLCELAPNNVNTMAAAAMAGHTLGFDRVQGSLVADPGLLNFHMVDIEVTGPVSKSSGCEFTVKTSRRNPAPPGEVTGMATYTSFWSSVLNCTGHGGKLFLC